MERFDVQVSVIEPGNYRSAIALTARNKTGELTDAQKNSPFAAEYTKSMEGSADRTQYKDPDEVAEAALHALFAEQPKLRYMVVPNKEEAGG